LKPAVTIYEVSNFCPIIGPNQTEREVVDFQGKSEACDFRKNLFNMEAKLSGGDDGFVDQLQTPEMPFVVDTEQGRIARGPIVAQMRNLMRFQSRRCVFSVHITPRWARLILADRSAGVITKRLDLGKEADVAQFLRFLSLMRASASGSYTAEVQRGMDPTLKPASPVAKDDFWKWFDQQSRPPWEIKRNSPVSVVTDNRGQEYLCVTKPVVSPVPELLSQGARIYYGMEVGSKKRVVIKDTWRYDLPGISTEKDIYAKLAAEPNSVRNIPIVIHAEDVLDQASRVSFHDTRRPADGNHVTLTPHVHHRLFFETVGFPFQSWRNARHLVMLIRQSILSKFEFAI
jgi:hypothetical protein